RLVSKLEFQCQLDRAGPADLVERVEAAAAATGAETVRERLRRAAEQGTGEDVVGTTEARVVEDVEELRPKREPCLLAHAKSTLQRDIGLPGTETPQHVASEITLPPGGRGRKGRPVEDLAAGILLSVELERQSGIQV